MALRWLPLARPFTFLSKTALFRVLCRSPGLPGNLLRATAGFYSQ